MRKDPPFDLEYLTSVWLLSQAEREGARVFNNPAAVRDHNEKLGILEFPQFVAPTLATRDPAAVHAFIDEHRDAILKRLDGMGGESIFRVRQDDPNRNVIVETMVQGGARSIMAQRYIPAIKDGDKRILLIDGKPVPHSLARIAKPGESRANLAAGGRGVAQPLTSAIRRSRARFARCWQNEACCWWPGRDRRLPHRGQRHESHLLPRNPGPDGLRCLGNVHRFAGSEAPMIGILIVAHGAFGEALIHSASHVLGKRPLRVRQVGVTVHDDPEAILPQASDLVQQLDEGKGVLVLTDIYGATPGNIALKLLVPGRVEGISGVNLPMLIRALTYREQGLATVVEESAVGRHRGRDTHDHGYLRQGSRGP